MSKKSNIITLRKSFKNFNFLNQKNQLFFFSFIFKRLVNRLFNLKGISVCDSTFNFVNNQLFCFLVGYTRYTKIRFLKKKKLKRNFFSLNTNLQQLFSSSLKNLKISLVIFKFKNLNLFIDRELLKYLYLKIKFVKRTLFARRFFLFMDFLALTSLFVQGLVKTPVFLQLLGDTFRLLPARRHKFFLSFLKKLFQVLIDIDFNHYLLKGTKIKGLKFILSGKIQGKLRGSKAIVQVGPVPIQSIEKNIEYSRIHVYTVFGSFGMKL